jgi:Family of unknown function (DUF5691)
MHELEAVLADMRSAWMAGRSAAAHCPESWREAVAGGEPEGALAALAGQAIAALFRPAPPAPLTPKPLLPRPALPLLTGQDRRGRLRRALAAQKGNAAMERQLITLVAARGLAPHPADWLPAAGDDWVPDAYASWLDWVRNEFGTVETGAITLDAYEDWPFAARRAALAKLRARDPAAARAIIAAKLAAEPAERRLQLVEILGNALTEADAELLESLDKDRSERVQVLARSLLARLGRTNAADRSRELAKELAAMLTLATTGLLRRRRRLEIVPLKTPAQRLRRHELFGQVGFADLAAALGVAPAQLLEMAPQGTPDEVADFVRLVAATGAEAACVTLADLLIDDASIPITVLAPLASRLPLGERRARLAPLFKRDGGALDAVLAFLGPALGEVPFALVRTSGSFAALKDEVEAVLRGAEAQQGQANAALEIQLGRLALLVDAAAAAALIEQLTKWGLSPADPKLDLLQLNALVPEISP